MPDAEIQCILPRGVKHTTKLNSSDANKKEDAKGIGSANKTNASASGKGKSDKNLEKSLPILKILDFKEDLEPLESRSYHELGSTERLAVETFFTKNFTARNWGQIKEDTHRIYVEKRKIPRTWEIPYLMYDEYHKGKEIEEDENGVDVIIGFLIFSHPEHDHIDTILDYAYVHPAFRGREIGRTMVQGLINSSNLLYLESVSDATEFFLSFQHAGVVWNPALTSGLRKQVNDTLPIIIARVDPSRFIELQLQDHEVVLLVSINW